MKSDTFGSFLALILAVIFVLVGLWLNVLSPSANHSSLPTCEYGITRNCEP